MRSTRKLASLLLALVMVFALAVTVAAEGGTGETPVTGTITVDNPREDQEYTAYKIFNVVYDNAGHYSYTIEGGGSGSPWYNTVHDYAIDANGLELTRVGDTNTYVVTFGKVVFSAPKFADALKKALTDGSVNDSGNPLTKSGTTASVTDLTLGYYFVTSSTGALCSLDTTTPDVTIHDKNNIPFEKTKTVGKDDFDVGDTVPFTITGEVPEHTIFTTYTYEITDKMSDGLTFNEDSLRVKVGNSDVTADPTKCTIDKGTAADSYTFKVTILVKNCTVGEEIEVTYSATINEKAVAQISNNKATLTYSNDPTDATKKTTTPTQEVDVYTSRIAIVKVAEGTKATRLKGAKFVLYKEVTTEGTAVATKMYYKWDDTAKKVKWVTEQDHPDVKETNENGEASFDGLANGIYHLVETKAPAGYNLLKQPYTVKVNEKNTPVTSVDQLTATATVTNKTGAVLPSTGGMGTTVFYVLGAVLVVGAGVLLVTKKRMSQGEV